MIRNIYSCVKLGEQNERLNMPYIQKQLNLDTIKRFGLYALANKWLRYSNQKKSIVYQPNPEKLGKYDLNFFIQNKAKPYDRPHNPAKIKRMTDHIFKYFCRGNVKMYRFYLKLKWQQFYRPWEKTERIMVMIDPSKGGGESLLEDEFWLGLCIGRDSGCVRDCHSLNDDKNGDMAGQRFIIFCEGTDANEKRTQIWERVKGWATDKFERIRRMYHDAFYVESFKNFVFMFNAEKGIIIELGDRRYFIFIPFNPNKDVKEYYTPLARDCQDPEVAAEFVTFLRDIYESELKDVDLRSDCPMTDVKRDVMLACMSGLHRFWYAKELEQMTPEFKVPTDGRKHW